mmetsp:Transcript_96596/g.133970  ORF Transcript_96596/g.133970 Transcript_96596/m.133970 type:complete len:166 (+) Transcript_96596:101-598(+)
MAPVDPNDDDAGAPAKMEPVIWIYVGSLYNPPLSFQTYDERPYSDMPELTDEMLERFREYETADDVKRKSPPIFHSPTDCYVDTSEEGLFYRDSQDCVRWYVNKDGTVGLKRDDPQQVVAKSLSECLARLDIENRLWFAMNMPGSEDADSPLVQQYKNAVPPKQE